MEPSPCKCGRDKPDHHPCCYRCYNGALTRLRSDPNYKAYIINHQAILSSLLFTARSYMGSSYRTE